MLRKQREDEWQRTAFGAWLMGAGGEKNFQDFLRHYGLMEKSKPLSAEAKKKADAFKKRIEQKLIGLQTKRPK